MFHETQHRKTEKTIFHLTKFFASNSIII